ncbi:MAG: DUF362 domain-containing protein [Candidatus Thorarchaeota archaeon]
MGEIDKLVIVESKDLKSKIKYCLETVDFTPSSNEFVLKPNIVYKHKSGSGHITDIRIVDSLIEILNESYNAKKIIIAEGPTAFLQNPMELFEYVGYTDLVKKYHNVSLVDIYQTSYKKIDNNFMIPEILEGRSLINLPVLKGHGQVGLTCAVKNLKGLLDRSDKKRFHKEGLHEHLSTLVNLKPEITLVDAITCQECEGDFLSKKYKFNLLICSKNPIIIDEFCSKLVGFNSDEIPYLKMLIEKEPLNYEIIGNYQQLANWNAPKTKFTYGKIDIYANDCCTYCVSALVQYLLPKRLKNHEKLGIILRIIRSRLNKERLSFIMGRTMNMNDKIEGKVFLFGNCAKDLYLGELIAGCPPLSRN